MTNGLPPLPDRFEDGADWLSQLGAHGWRMVPSWGRDGWDLLEWPYAAVAHFDGEERFGLAIYEEGDVSVESFEHRQARDAVTDWIAVQYWRANGRGPRDLPDGDGVLAPHHRGPFSLDRAELEGRP